MNIFPKCSFQIATEQTKEEAIKNLSKYLDPHRLTRTILSKENNYLFFGNIYDEKFQIRRSVYYNTFVPTIIGKFKKNNGSQNIIEVIVNIDVPTKIVCMLIYLLCGSVFIGNIVAMIKKQVISPIPLIFLIPIIFVTILTRANFPSECKYAQSNLTKIFTYLDSSKKNI